MSAAAPSYDKDPARDFSFSAVDRKTLVPAHCPLCEGARSTARYPLRLGFIVRCERCGFNYVSPRLPSSWLHAKTQAWANSDVVDDERLRIAFEARTLTVFGELIERCERLANESGRRLLDVGCSTGAFLTVARERRWQTHGIELGLASASYARNQLGLDVTVGSLFEFQGGAGAYDLVSFLEVIEHLEEPRRALKHIAGWLAPGGLLLLSTPNFNSLFRRLFGTRWWVIDCEDEHIQFFTPKTLTGMLEAEGFEVVHMRIRGIDAAGLASAALGRLNVRTAAPQTAACGYHGARERKERIKALLGRFGVLGLVRGGLSCLEWLFSVRGSPLYAMGEQIIAIARKPLP